MLVSELTEVAIGSDHTPVMQKQKMAEVYDCYCLSIIGRDRSLDLKYDDSKIIQIWCDSIKQLIEASRQKEQGIQREFQNQHESPNNKALLTDMGLMYHTKDQIPECLEYIWKTEILNNLQHYYNPQSRQLNNDKEIFFDDPKIKQDIVELVKIQGGLFQ